MKDALKAFLAVAASAVFFALPEKWQSALWSITIDIYTPWVVLIGTCLAAAWILRWLYGPPPGWKDWGDWRS